MVEDMMQQSELLTRCFLLFHARKESQARLVVALLRRCSASRIMSMR